MKNTLIAFLLYSNGINGNRTQC